MAVKAKLLRLFISVIVLVEGIKSVNAGIKSDRGSKKPNVIIFLADDTGFDFKSYGHPTQEWGGIDDLARDGMRLTQMVSAASTCTPSRASLLTGRYAVRSGIVGMAPAFSANSQGGLPKAEITIAEALKNLGYTTGFVGKWHLGINEVSRDDGAHLPIHHGFDYVGMNFPYSHSPECDAAKFSKSEMKACFVYHNTTIVEQPSKPENYAKTMLQDAKTFIKENKNKPFFLYYSFPHTHTALFCDKRFCGKSRRGLYGDNVNEMAWSVGKIRKKIEDLNLSDDTLIIFLSDHGPDENRCPDGGSAGYFRGFKGSTWEGGVRIPAMAVWPGKIPANTIGDAVVSSLDIFPTLLSFAGNPNYLHSKKVVYDGKDISDVLTGAKKTFMRTLFYYCSSRLTAVRYNQYKIHYMTNGDGTSSVRYPAKEPNCQKFKGYGSEYLCSGKHVIPHDPPLVFDLESDPAENYSVDTSTPEMKEMLKEVALIVARHKSSIAPVEEQLSKPLDDKFMPCCNYPLCEC